MKRDQASKHRRCVRGLYVATSYIIITTKTTSHIIAQIDVKNEFILCANVKAQRRILLTTFKINICRII